MPWTDIDDLSTGDLVTAAIWDDQVKANLEYLLSGRSLALATQASGADYTVVGTTWTNVDATNLILEITPASTRVVLFASFRMVADNTAGSASEARWSEATAGVSGARARVGQNTTSWVAFAYRYSGLTPGNTYTFVLQFRNATAGATTTINRSDFPITLLGWEV